LFLPLLRSIVYQRIICHPLTFRLWGRNPFFSTITQFYVVTRLAKVAEQLEKPKCETNTHQEWRFSKD
jgi:hypothetical protein